MSPGAALRTSQRSRSRSTCSARARAACSSLREAGVIRAPDNPVFIVVCRPTSRFSSTVSDGKSSARWKLRAMPAATTACGGSPSTSTSPSRIVPSVTGQTRESALMSVVLPAPFGPTRAKMPRSGTSRSSALTATRPPKRTVTPRASSILPHHALRRVPSGAPRTARAQKGLEAAGKEQHDEHDHPAEECERESAHGGGRVLHRVDDDGAADRAGNRTHAADDHHREEQQRALDAEILRCDESREERVDAAGGAGEKCADEEGEHLRARDRNAHRRGGDLAVLDRGERA